MKFSASLRHGSWLIFAAMASWLVGSGLSWVASGAVIPGIRVPGGLVQPQPPVVPELGGGRLARLFGFAPDHEGSVAKQSPVVQDAPAGAVWQVWATMVATDRPDSFALLVDSHSQSTAYVAVGDQLGSLRIQDIQRDPMQVTAVEQSTGRSVVFRGVGAAQAAPGVSPPTAGADSSGITRISPTDATITRSAWEAQLSDTMGLAAQAHISPVLRNGAPEGWMIDGLNPKSSLAQIGLAQGDILKSVNGVALVNAQEALQAFAQLRQESDFSVEVERQGAPVQLHLRVL